MRVTPRRSHLRAIEVAVERLALAEEIAADVTAVGFYRQGRLMTNREKRAVLFAIAWWGMALREPVVMEELRKAAA